jgi:hypothetical protein
VTENEPDPGKMLSVEEHQEISKEEAAVMPVEGLRKRGRDRNLAAGCHQKPKGRIQTSCESRRRLTIAGKTTCRTTAAWRKRNVFKKKKKTGTKGIHGPWKTDRCRNKYDLHARVAWPEKTTSERIGPGTRHNKKSRNDERTED